MEEFDPFDAGMAFLGGLENLAKAHGAEGTKLEFDGNGECVLAVAGRFAVVLALDTELSAIIVTIPIAPLPEDGSILEVMSEMLCGNYAWNLTEGGTLAVDRATSLVVLNYLVPLPLEAPESAGDILAKLLDVCDYWERKIRSLAQSGDGAEALPQGFLRA